MAIMLVTGGALLVFGVVRRVARSVRSRINVAPLSEEWLAEQKLVRHGW